MWVNIVKHVRVNTGKQRKVQVNIGKHELTWVNIGKHARVSVKHS